MQNSSYKNSKIAVMRLLFLFFFLLPGNSAFSDETPPADEAYREHFKKYTDNRSFPERVRNAIGYTKQDIGRSFALIAGVYYYPNMSQSKQNLEPAEEDIRKLQDYLEEYEYFDEIVVLENNDMTTENLEYFFQSYFPKRLKEFPKSRFLFAYSGHGMNEGTKGYLLKHTAQNLKDKDNSINLQILKVYIDEVVDAGHHVLVLLNACYGGVFLKRSFGDENKLLPKHRGAHAITAGGSGELTWHDPDMGLGSLFFEKVIAGLGGHADNYDDDGIITVSELAIYVKREIQIFTDQNQNPQLGDISKDGSRGEFFFLNRDRQVSEGHVPEFKPEKATPMGINSEKLYIKGKESLNDSDYITAAYTFRQAAEAGNEDAMLYLGIMYQGGTGVTKDYDEAMDWYHKAADAGNARAMFQLGLMYKDGQGITKDIYEAISLFEEAGEAGESHATVYLGSIYHKGLGGVPIDYNRARRLYRKAEKAGNTNAMFNLGYIYENGQGVTKDYDEGIFWYSKAAEAGNTKALNRLRELVKIRK